MLRCLFPWMQDPSVEKVAILYAISKGKQLWIFIFCLRVATGLLPRYVLPGFFVLVSTGLMVCRMGSFTIIVGDHTLFVCWLLNGYKVSTSFLDINVITLLFLFSNAIWCDVETNQSLCKLFCISALWYVPRLNCSDYLQDFSWAVLIGAT